MLELKNTITRRGTQQMGSTVEWRGTEESICKHEDRTIEVIQFEKQKEN